jgi:hypothetical protein
MLKKAEMEKKPEISSPGDSTIRYGITDGVPAGPTHQISICHEHFRKGDDLENKKSPNFQYDETLVER